MREGPEDRDAKIRLAEVAARSSHEQRAHELYTSLSEVDCFPSIEKGRTTRTVDGSRQKYNFEITVHCPGEEDEHGGSKATKAAHRPHGDGQEEAL